MATRIRALVARKRVLVISVVVLVVILAGAAVWAATRPASAAAPRLVAAATGTIRQTVSASGVIQPAQIANLNFAVSGQVSAVSVAVGQQVQSGQALASVTSAALPSQVAQANAAIANANAKLAADTSAGANSAQIAADQAAVTADQDQLNSAKQALSEATLTTPISGTVAAVNLTVGQQVSGGGTQQGSTPGSGNNTTANNSGNASSASTTAQVVVISTGSYVVLANVDDTEIAQVKTGDQAVITPNGSAAPVYGTVSSVGVVASQTSGVATYPVSIAVTGSPSGLFAGASAQVQLVVKQVSNVLVIPTAAIHTVNGKSVVYELDSAGNQVSHELVVGLSSGGQTQITSGLDEGTQVVIPGEPRSSGGTTGTGGAGRGGFGTGGGFGGGTGRGGFGGNQGAGG